MTEIQEVAEAIKLKYGQLWPLSSEMAAYIAMKEAGDQGHTVISNLTHALRELNGPSQSKSQNSSQQPGLLSGIVWEASPYEANVYRLLRGNKWVAHIRMNGEMFPEQQEALLTAMLAQGNSDGSS